jgi:hypothetical protein
MSAALAREYDGQDLLHEPWHLLIPPAASFITASILFGVLWIVAKGPARPSYRSFLTVYWMTAPVAWLYAIPVERMLSASDSTVANLWLLAAVSLWRVVLMIRVVCVLWPVLVWQAFFVVMFFADTILLIALSVTPRPIFMVMGGIRLTASEDAILVTSFIIGNLGVLSWPFWLIGAIGAAFARKEELPPHVSTDESSNRVQRSAWGLAGASLFAGLTVLPFTQPAQHLRYSVEQDLRKGRITEGLTTMSMAGEGSFPRHWDPPPRVGYGEKTPELIDVLEALPKVNASPGVEEVFHEKFVRFAGSGDHWAAWRDMDSTTFDRYLTVLETQFQGSKKLEEFKYTLQAQLQGPATDEQKDRIRKLVGRPEWDKEEPVADVTAENLENSPYP